MPCSEKRARQFMDRGKAKPKWKNQIFYIQLQQEPSARNYQEVVVAIDTGSKREAYTVATAEAICLNIMTDTQTQVKENVETRKNLRRTRRSRNTPYRACRFNRKTGGIPPSTKARWGSKIRIVKFLCKLFPITAIGIEDVSAVTKKGQRRWNVNFSPIEVGKHWCYAELRELAELFIYTGWENAEERSCRGFTKIKEKLKLVWEAHCVDSHIMCERLLGVALKPFLGLHFVQFFKWARRQLHIQNPVEDGYRKPYGTTITVGRPRGTLLRHIKWGLCYLGGFSQVGISLHSLTGKRLTQSAKSQDCVFLGILKWRSTFLPDLRSRVRSLGSLEVGVSCADV